MTKQWLQEPNSHSFSFLGYRAFLVRQPYFKTWCCYVKIPEGHTARGKHDIWSATWKNLHVHGGITFADFPSELILKNFDRDELSVDDFLIGLDASHAYDVIPGLELDLALNLQSHGSRQYRDITYCIEELKELIQQLVELNTREPADVIYLFGEASKTL